MLAGLISFSWTSGDGYKYLDGSTALSPTLMVVH
jgi:hypothetical protein